jgi:hypothetical protein
MMKKYNKPEIVALALEAVDVIETSGGEKAAAVMGQDTEITGGAPVKDNIQVIEQQITAMKNTWSW